MRLPFATLFVFLVACGGSTDDNAAAGGTAGQTGGGGSGGATGGGGGSAGSAVGGAAGSASFGGLGGWGPAGEHAVTRIAVGHATWGPTPTPASVFFGVSEQISSGKHVVYRLDKATGNANVVAEYPADGTSHAVTEERVIVAGHGKIIEGPPPDGWLKSIDVASGVTTEIATFPQATPIGLVVSGDQLWFIVDGMLSRIPLAGGAVEPIIAVTDVSSFATSGTRVFMTGASGISAYDSSTASVVPVATWTEAWSDQKLRAGWFYWRTMTASPALIRVAEAGGAPAEILPTSGLSFAVGAHHFRDGGVCPSATVVRANLAGAGSADWVTGGCYLSGLVIDGEHLYFFDSQPSGLADLVRVDVE
jgi:hypothetical protein